MKKIIGAAMLVTLLTTTAITANAANNTVYLGLSGDLMWPQDEDISSGRVQYDVSGGANISIGYKAMNNIRAELEGGYHWLNLDEVIAGGTIRGTNDNFRVATLMANLYYDMPVYSGFSPYIGAGLGDAYLNFPRDAGLGTSDNTDNELAYQAMAGVTYTPEMTPMTDWSIGYHYLGVHKPEFSGVRLDSLNTHSLQVGMRQHF